MALAQIPTECVIDRLTAEDDAKLWANVLAVLNEEFLSRYKEAYQPRQAWYLRVGACSHWLRSNRGRWRGTGGFAWPVGYKDASGFSGGLPEFDWSVILAFDGEQWKCVEKFSGKRQITLRAAIPTRTTRHKQVAIHTIWSTPHRRIFYGFRNIDARWNCVATYPTKLQKAA